MEETNKQQCHECAHNNICGWHHRHLVLRWLLGLLILVVVFWVGVKVGEFKGYFENIWSFEGPRHFRQTRFMMQPGFGGDVMYFRNTTAPKDGAQFIPSATPQTEKLQPATSTQPTPKTKTTK